MGELPDKSNFFSALYTKMPKKRVAALYRALGWEVRKCAWYDYELRVAWADLVIDDESPILLHGRVSDAIKNAEALLAPLRAANISFEAEYYGPEGELLKEWEWKPGPMPPAPQRRFSLHRIVVAVLFSLPGIGLAMLAKPLLLGDAGLLLGLLLALAAPIYWLSRPSTH